MIRWFVETAREWSLESGVVRMVTALVVGTLIGLDRGIKCRGAGIKTHTLVCLGAALVMMTGEYIYMNFPERLDISRMGAQVISGVGFLGVGTIIVNGKNQIRGLTTAAGLWAYACIGFVEGAVIALALVLFALRVLTRLDEFIRHHAKIFDLYLEFETSRGAAQFMEEIRNQGMKLTEFELSKNKIKGEGPTAIATLEVRDKKKRRSCLILSVGWSA